MKRIFYPFSLISLDYFYSNDSVYNKRGMSKLPVQYFNLEEENYSKYGVTVIQFIQIGKFYELWHETEAYTRYKVYLQTELLNELPIKSVELNGVAPIYRVASLLDMRITSPGKRALLQMGFPTYSLPVHLGTLLSKGWTVVIIGELPTPAGAKKREVLQVYSPGCNTEEYSELPYVLSVSFSSEGWTVDSPLGVTLFSVWNGDIKMFPVSWGEEEKAAGLLVCYSIKEIVIWANPDTPIEKIHKLLMDWKLFPVDPNTRIEFMEEARIDFPRYLSYRYFYNMEWVLLHVYLGIKPEWHNKNYREYILSKIFGSTWAENVNETNLISLLGVLDFISERNPDFIRNLSYPECYNSPVDPLSLILCNRAEYQLDLFPKGGKLGGILSLINYCSTAMGRRLLKFRLFNPTTDCVELNLRYKEIDIMKQLIDNNVLDNSNLKGIKDLSSLHRKWAICASGDSILPTNKLSQLYGSYLLAMELINKLESELDKNQLSDIQLTPLIGVQLKSLIKKMDQVFLINNSSEDLPHFKSGIKIDSISLKDVLRQTDRLTNLFEQEQILRAQLTKWAEETSIKVFKDKTSIKIEYFNKEGYAASVKSKNLAKLEPYMLDNQIVILCKKRSSYIISSYTIQKVLIKLGLLEEEINTYVKEAYCRELKILYIRYSKLFKPLVDVISRLDFSISGAITASKFNYTKPCLVESRGSIEAVNLRHPLVEQLNTQEECVAHNVSLEGKGMLLFSVNGAGKSTLLKAIGVNVILAQAGMFVAADSFRLGPYNYLVTRILGGDDIHKGQGTFEVEMRDLATILKFSSYNSLILGDEICHGTEVNSGISILAATIERLVDSQTSFVLSTHLHEIKSLINSSVRLYHLTTIRDEDLGIVYERKLKPGTGPSQYGIEVMAHIIRDKEFYKSTLKYRNLINSTLKNEPAALRASRYNAQVFIDVCELCGATGEAIHHIKPKKSSPREVNRRSNLVPVCRSCHYAIHKKEITIIGWKRSPEYKKLYWVYGNKSGDSGTE